MTKNKQNKLTHSDYYIYWAKKEEWSLTEAVYLLHGFVPPGPKLAIDQLIKDFPDIKRLVENLPEKKLKKFTSPPKEWVMLAISDGMDVTDCWKLIYPDWIPDDVNIALGKILNYPRFIKVLGTNTDTSLEELVRFALNLRDEKMVNPPRAFDHLLDDMATRLGIKTNSPEELRKWRGKPRQFMERCPKDNFAYDSECQHWFKLLKSKPGLADWLEVTSNVKEGRPVQIKEAVVTQAPKSKNTKANTRIQKGDNSLSKKGGAARAALYAPLRQEVNKLYEGGQFKSKRQASKDLYQLINTYAYNEKFKIPAPRPSTIYTWLRCCAVCKRSTCICVV